MGLRNRTALDKASSRLAFSSLSSPNQSPSGHVRRTERAATLPPRLIHKAVPDLLREKLKIIVGPEDDQRTWFLPRSLLSTHSTFFATYISTLNTSTAPEILLPNLEHRMFENVVSFMHSNIYALNENIDGFWHVQAHLRAYHVGRLLGVKQFWRGALCSLYRLFITMNNNICDNTESPIQAWNVEYLFMITKPGEGLRVLFLDAMASHWTRDNIWNVGEPIARYYEGEDEVIPWGADEGVLWGELFEAHTDLRAVLRGSMFATTQSRAELLKDLRYYLDIYPTQEPNPWDSEALEENGDGKAKIPCPWATQWSLIQKKRPEPQQVTQSWFFHSPFLESEDGDVEMTDG